MKKQLMILAALIAFGGINSSALADHHAEGKRGERFQDADTDGDGFLSQSEMQAQQEKRMKKMFSEADVDNDGKLSKEELRDHRKDMRGKMRERWEKRRDARGDNDSE